MPQTEFANAYDFLHQIHLRPGAPPGDAALATTPRRRDARQRARAEQERAFGAAFEFGGCDRGDPPRPGHGV
ncbi:hypothetical protein ACIGEZ_26870 [Streptomyces sp. NPDC085481]|uniref:hypothetical protein n=1 Tax=Streptomyces sp. NPDC085481 TaxID=3365727 RepID=UPI0037CD700F